MSRVECAAPDREHTVYVVSTPDASEVLYVGMTSQVDNRLIAHRHALSPWSVEPHVVDLWPVPNRTEARALERVLIEALHPRDNKQHRPTGRHAA